MSDQRRVVCAANRYPDGTIVCGVRHFDMLMHNVLAKLEMEPGKEEQGFVDYKGQFLTREEARVIAFQNGQIEHVSIHPTRLFSEDLY